MDVTSPRVTTWNRASAELMLTRCACRPLHNARRPPRSRPQHPGQIRAHEVLRATAPCGDALSQAYPTLSDALSGPVPSHFPGAGKVVSRPLLAAPRGAPAPACTNQGREPGGQGGLGKVAGDGRRPLACQGELSPRRNENTHRGLGLDLSVGPHAGHGGFLCNPAGGCGVKRKAAKFGAVSVGAESPHQGAAGPWLVVASHRGGPPRSAERRRGSVGFATGGGR